MSGYKGLREIVWETIKENIIVLFLAVGLWFLYLCGIFSECFVLYLIKIEDIIPVTVAASISLLGLLVAAVTFQAKSNKEEIEKAADYVQKMTSYDYLQIISAMGEIDPEPNHDKFANEMLRKLNINESQSKFQMIRVAFTKIGEKYDFDWEIRNKLMRLAVLVFGFAILLLFKPLLPIFEIILILLCVSIFVAILYHAYKLIRRIIGYY